MIISHKYGFIFLKTSKTAGTSVEIALSRFCGPDDIITPVSADDELKRQAAGGVAPQNYLVSPLRYTPFEWWKKLTRGKPALRFYNHIPARKVKRRIGSDIWDRYYKFCIERNPWDRVISQYYWRQRNLGADQMPSIVEFLDSDDTRSLKRKGFQLYTLKGQVAVDKICRYESLEEDLEEVRQHLGLPEPLELPSAKSGIRKDKRHYSEVLSETEKDRIAELFKDEIELMGYKF
ncbi:sulfotransferase family protein [Halospina denitrificans]|uniref:Sulfotransferase family protein n=1 Tax=Halospina denitrificans TaxID=332522 RepID=A0A4R7K0J0_9GAMM|nr:sulfotransferase family 2 domain-containing protein [Halospina denitrificans]TDT44340.1 sulfotransferase family protein [Halospina denitrificans]